MEKILTSGPQKFMTIHEQTIINREYIVQLPNSSITNKYPVIILLHGNGGTAIDMLNKWVNNKYLNELVNKTHIIVAPQGFKKSWNVINEDSTVSDLEFITNLIYRLKTFENVSPNFTLYGESNGAALINNILIESDDKDILTAITDGSQLNTHQYKNNNFYILGPRDNSGNNQYVNIQKELLPRRILSLQGALDKVVPAWGGKSSIPGEIEFLSHDDSIYKYAKAFGYDMDKKEPVAMVGSNYTSYLRNMVVTYIFHKAGHITINHFNVGEIIGNFIKDSVFDPEVNIRTEENWVENVFGKKIELEIEALRWDVVMLRRRVERLELFRIEKTRTIDEKKFSTMNNQFTKLLNEINVRDPINERLTELEERTVGNNNLINKLINKGVGVVSHLKTDDVDVINNYNNRFEQMENQIIEQNKIINDLFKLLKK